MSEGNYKTYFTDCPRCRWRTLEYMPSYTYCANCNYSDVEEERDKIPYHIVLLLQEREREMNERLAKKCKTEREVKRMNHTQLLQEAICG